LQNRNELLQFNQKLTVIVKDAATMVDPDTTTAALSIRTQHLVPIVGKGTDLKILSASVPNVSLNRSMKICKWSFDWQGFWTKRIPDSLGTCRPTTTFQRRTLDELEDATRPPFTEERSPLDELEDAITTLDPRPPFPDEPLETDAPRCSNTLSVRIRWTSCSRNS
jgi:hypothetical protein